jgi:hypothetical protein
VPELLALAVFVVIVVVVAVVGIRLGMLIAPRLGRLAEGDDEEDRAADD